MKAHIFLIANPKFQLQILCSFGDIPKMVKLIGIPENNFLCIFITASSPGVQFLLPLESKQEATTGWNFTKWISEVKVNQLKVKNMHVKMGISSFKEADIGRWIFGKASESCYLSWLGLGLWIFSIGCIDRPRSESNPELSVRKLHILWGCKLLELGLRQM